MNNCNCRHLGKWRMYKMADGIWTFGFSVYYHGKGHAIMLGRWVLTDEVCSDE